VFLLDLRWLLFGFLLAMTVASSLAVWLDRQRRGKQEAAFLGLEGMQSVLERAPLGWLVLEGPSTYRYANPHARRLLGLSPLVGPFPEANWVPLLEEDRVAARREGDAAGRYRNVSLSSNLVARWWVTPCDDLDVVFLLDVTAQRQAEQAARDLLNSLSHELRTPLGTILTHSEILLLPDVSEEIRQQSLRLLKAETKRMSRLINHMLALGRLETSAEIERRPVDLLRLAEQAVAQVSPLAEERGIELSLEAETPLPFVVGKPDYLLQVFLNLLDNAIKYSRPGDRAVVSLQRGEGGVECVVRDTGPGIPAEHLPHVARRFYRAAPQEVEGSGLGLSLVEEILRRHGSCLVIESRTEGKERGTNVQFVLPVLPEEEEGA
jgi:signal transduction histidine kinase